MLQLFEKMDADKITLAQLDSWETVEFFLTGSRFFDPKSSEERDWDLFTKYTPFVEEQLVKAEFTKIGANDPDYDIIFAQNIRAIYRKGKVDVQLVYDVEGKLWIQDQLKKMKALSGLDKKERKRVWQIAYRFAYGNTISGQILGREIVSSKP